MNREQRVDAFNEWRLRPGRLSDRIEDLDRVAAADPEAWRDAMLSVVPSRASVDWLEEGNLTWLGVAVRAALRTTRDRAAMQSDLAERAHQNPVVAAVAAYALAPLGSNQGSVNHAIAVLGEDLLFDAWSNAHWNMRDDKTQADAHERLEVEVDQWADALMTQLTFRDPESAWALFLRYLAYETDAGLRAQAGIAWLETINFRFAADFIDRIEAEARESDRLRAVMRRMYPPLGEPSIQERFKQAAQEPIV